MKKFGWTMAFAALAAGVWAQGTVLYAPTRPISDQSISVRAWGSGSMAETDEVAFEGVFSLRVSTRNFFAGGFMTLAKPVDLSGAIADKNNLLRFQIRVADASLTLGGAGGARAGGGGGRAGAGGGAGAAGLGGEDGAGGRGGALAGGGASNATAETTLRTIRLIFTTSDGKKSEVFVPIGTSRAGERGWMSVAVPLQAISGMDKTNKNVTEIGISGDATTTFYVGDVRIVNDSTPLTGGVQQTTFNLALGDEIDLSAWGFGGSSVLKYTWDFDDKDGIQEEAEGANIKRRFRKAGKFVVTMTVSDVYGLKKAYSTKVNVTVNP